MQQAEWDGYDNNFHPAAPALQFGPFAPQFAAQVTNTKNKNTYLKKHKKNREKYHECFFNYLRGHSHITLCPRGGGGGQLKHNIL